MKLVVAFDKFKGSATAQQLNQAAAQAARLIDNVHVVEMPVADGGDGTTAALANNTAGQWFQATVNGPLHTCPPVNATYFVTQDNTAIIEVASANGLALLADKERDVMHTSTWGTGMLIADAIERGCRHVVLGLGGSASCDGGMGLMAALGVEFIDVNGHLLPPCGSSLEHIADIDTSGIQTSVLDTHFSLLADVNNPLCGGNGAAATYAPQKGASTQQVEQLERGLRHVANIVGEHIANAAGCGAAGGIPSLMLHTLSCELVPGARYVLEHNGMEAALNDADMVITGEGRLDATSLMGKATGTVLEMAHSIPVVAICGSVDSTFLAAQSGFERIIDLGHGLHHDVAMETQGTLNRVQQAVHLIIQQYKKS